jgi:hypothetical protein
MIVMTFLLYMVCVVVFGGLALTILDIGDTL